MTNSTESTPTRETDPYVQYGYRTSEPSHTALYLEDALIAALRGFASSGATVLDAGCGNGWLSARLFAEGFQVSAFDLSETGIEIAAKAHPHIEFRVGSVYDDLVALFGRRFSALIATEVVEHLYSPRAFVRRCREALTEGGKLILSTPYHGYLKNALIALAGKSDSHFGPLWEGGHIKFWSRATLTQLLESEGFRIDAFRGVGRLPYLWKSMIVVATNTGA